MRRSARVVRYSLMAPGELIEERLTHSVIGAFYEVYNTLGFGFLEHIYVMALERELLARVEAKALQDLQAKEEAEPNTQLLDSIEECMAFLSA